MDSMVIHYGRTSHSQDTRRSDTMKRRNELWWNHWRCRRPSGTLRVVRARGSKWAPALIRNQISSSCLHRSLKRRRRSLRSEVSEAWVAPRGCTYHQKEALNESMQLNLFSDESWVFSATPDCCAALPASTVTHDHSLVPRIALTSISARGHSTRRTA